MNRLGIALILAWGLTTLSLPAQTVFNAGWQFPPGFPATSPDPVFSTRESMALHSNGSFFLVDGLPHGPVTTRIVSSPFDPQEAVIEIAADVALGEGGGELILVRGLPEQAVIVPTGIFTSAFGFKRVNDSTAVRVVGSNFEVLRHGASGATLHTLASPLPLSTYHAPAPAGESRFVASGGAGDQTMVILRDLDLSPAAFGFDIYGLPGQAPLDGFLVTEKGVVVTWDVLPGAVMALSWTSFPSSGPTTTTMTLSASAISATAVLPARLGNGDDVICRFADGATVQARLAVRAGFTGNPYISRTWWEQDFVGATRFDPIGSGVYLEYDQATIANTGAFIASRPTESPSFTSPLTLPHDGTIVDARMANEDTLVVLHGGTNDGIWRYRWLTVFARVSRGLESWTRYVFAQGAFPPSQPSHQLVSMSLGQIGVLYQGLAPWPTLDMVALPTVYPAGDSGSLSSGIQFLYYDVPFIGQQALLDLVAHHTETALPYVAFSLGRKEPQPLPPPFASDERLHLDPSTFIGIAAATELHPGRWWLDLGTENWPIELAGIEIYTQGIQLSSAMEFTLTRPLLLIGG